MVNLKSSGFDKGTRGKSGKFQLDCDGCILFTRRSINITNSFSFSLQNLPFCTVFYHTDHSDLVTDTVLLIVILAAPGEYSVQSLLPKSLEHSSIHYFCFCSVKFAQFFINDLDLTANNEYSGRVASFNAMWQERYTPLNFC